MILYDETYCDTAETSLKLESFNYIMISLLLFRPHHLKGNSYLYKIFIQNF